MAPGYQIDWVTPLGLVAAAATTFAYLPQVIKAWRTGSTGDLSLWMVLLLTCGVALWVGYGILRDDFVIILANVVSFLFLINLLGLKLSEVFRDRRRARREGGS